MKLSDNIHLAEKLFLVPVEKFFTGIYNNNNLTSHGIDHHRRVWNYAKELLYYMKEDVSDPLFIQKLLITCYLHDIGMATDTGTRHGRYSMRFCMQFLNECKLNESDFMDVLQAIEYHDIKEYQDSSQHNLLLTILSVADDLDAFGYTGIYRYAEIYLKRGISYDKIGKLVLENAAKRFEHLSLVFKDSNDLVKKYEKKYSILTNFFNLYNNSIDNYKFNSGIKSGYCGIIEIISESLNNQVSSEKNILENRFSDDNIISGFFESLLLE